MFKKVSKTDIQIIIICVLIFTGSFFVLFFDLFNQQKNSSDEPIVATSVEVFNDVRVKAKQQFAWSKSSNQTAIRYGDQIFTGDQSKAVIELLDGQKINISENSLIKFDQKQNAKNFKILFGSVKTQLKKNETIEVTICGEKHLIKSEADDELTISNNENCVKPEFKFNNSKSTVQLKKKKAVLSDLVTTLVEKSKPVVVVAPPVNLEKPEIAEAVIKSLVTVKNKKIQWRPVLQAQQYKIEIFDKNQPEVAINKLETTESFFEFNPNPSVKDYIFSVQAVSTQKEYLPSPTANGEINIQYPPIRINEKLKLYTMNARTSDQPAKPIEHLIQWSKIPHAAQYKIEFSEDESFKKIVSVDKSATNSLKIKLENLGKKYYKVRAFNSKGQELTQSIDVSSIEYNKKFDLLPPEIHPNSIDQALFFQKTEGQFIRLNWKNNQIALAPKYYIEISTSEDFNQIFKKISADQQSLVLNEAIPQGQYYWRVKSYGKDIVSNWSKIAKLKINSQRNTASEIKK